MWRKSSQYTTTTNFYTLNALTKFIDLISELKVERGRKWIEYTNNLNNDETIYNTRADRQTY